LLYGGLFLASGAALLAFADVLVLSLHVGSHVVSTRAGTGGLPSNVSRPNPPAGADLRQVLVYSAVALVVMAVACAPLGWLVAGRVLRPFRTIMATARDISATNLSERLNLAGPYDEFVELGNTLDDLFGRLEASFESQRHFVANASHELRTPLTVERALIQVALADPNASAAALRQTCEELLIIGVQQERLVDALLTLASSERGVERREPVDLAELTNKVVQLRADEADRRGIQLDRALDRAGTEGDKNLMESLITNLIDNALRHNVPGGQVEIATTTSTEGQATITVRNTGTTIEPTEVDRLFQPFQRRDHQRTHKNDGHGLGLAIVATIAKAHQAKLAVNTRPTGGLDIKVSFPPTGPTDTDTDGSNRPDTSQ
jgi:signal transduction histidine kinase